MDNKEQTLVLVKPDAMIKGLAGEVLSTIAKEKIDLVGAKLVRVSEELAKIHYVEHEGKPFFAKIIEHITGKHHVDHVLALVYEGENVIENIRSIAGATHPEEADPLSLRGRYGRIHTQTEMFENVIHASANTEDAKREVQLWFEPAELLDVVYPTQTKEVTKNVTTWSE